LEQQLQVKEQEVERAQRELYQTKLDFEDRVKKLNDELDAFRTREHDILAVSTDCFFLFILFFSPKATPYPSVCLYFPPPPHVRRIL
jgi:hypothetical protein